MYNCRICGNKIKDSSKCLVTFINGVRILMCGDECKKILAKKQRSGNSCKQNADVVKPSLSYSQVSL